MTSVSLFTNEFFETSSLTTERLLDNRPTVSDNSTLDLSTNATYSKSDDETSTIENVTKWIWIIGSPIVFILGIFGNFGIILVLYRMNRWKKLTYKLILILAISDSVVLFIGLGRQWLRFAIGLDIRLFSDFSCKFFVFLIYFSMHFSSWTLVCVTFERYLKTRHPFRTYCVNVSKILKITYVFTIVITLGLDSHLLVTNGLKINTKNSLTCNNTSTENFNFEEHYFVFIDLAWVCFFPFVLMTFMNVFVGRTIRRSFRRTVRYMPDPQNRERHVIRNKKLTRMIFWTSVYFLLTTLPISVHFCVDSFLKLGSTKETTDKINLSEAILYLFQFTNYSVNFYIYFKFKDAFREYLPCKRRSRFSIERQSHSVSRGRGDTTLTNVDNSVGNGSVHELKENVNRTIDETQLSEDNEGMQKIFIALTVLISISQVEGWFFRRVRVTGDTRNCFCKIYDADTNTKLHDFGSIQSCFGWPTCACRRHEMVTCGDKCDQRVAGWLKYNKSKCQGRTIKKHYQASTCGSPTYGHERRVC
ncbi:type-1 angiotensin II receptor B-like [Mytilus californianus]|uniref:type-1 angiotensin II receptor B-like n=1 Tax=Mytilus californianus TaxID=6549 RepID=UPI002245BE5A|nr:type-1 angiotensin II receptor B-like [Mytilus californianus]